MYEPNAKQQKFLEGFILKGRCLKEASQAMTDHLAGVVEGLVGEVLENDDVVATSSVETPGSSLSAHSLTTRVEKQQEDLDGSLQWIM